MDAIIFGDNQFFGINHMSEEKARAQSMKFRDAASIIRVVDSAYDIGIRSFMFTTHDAVAELCDHFRRHSSRYSGLKLLPGMPYAHKYANAVAEKGIVQTLSDVTAGNKWTMFATGSLALVRQDLARLVKILVDAEMRMFDGLETPIIFLQNIVTDLMLGIGEVDAFSYFEHHVRSRYGAEPGYVTMNLPALLHHLTEKVGLSRPIICSSVNPIGYLMHPTREACEAVIRTGTFECIAMSVLASGAVSAEHSARYLSELGNVRSVLFGASSEANIRATVERMSGVAARR